MKIKAFPFQAARRLMPGQRVDGQVEIPKGSKIIHVGAAPPNGEMFMYCEISEVEMPMVTLDLCILKVDDTVPDGYMYRGYILAIPILFVYERPKDKIITS